MPRDEAIRQHQHPSAADRGRDLAGPASTADRNPYVGIDAVVAGVFGRLDSFWKPFEVKVDELAGGGNVVTMFGRYRGQAAKSGKPLDVQVAHTWWIDAGKAVRFQQMVDTAAIQRSLA